MAGTKFYDATSKLLLMSFSTFIMLNAAVVTEETRKCYWCGPLAEQVHRSRRAPACEAPANYVTACEPGLPYCAIVATSPPYVESRLCVKLYQDECYPLYCNSTKTWKMTCPCQGDMCNGANTDREIEAFDVLTKLVAKTRTTRIKKRTQINTVKFIPSGDEKTVIITNISALESNELSNGAETGNINDEVTHIMMMDEPNADIQELKEESMIMSTDITTDDTDEQSIETTQEIIPETTAKTLPDSEVVSKKIPQIKEFEKEILEVTRKTNKDQPTAEALQQNASPKTVSEKITVITTSSYETTYLTTTDNDIDVTTAKAVKKGQKNESNVLYTNILNIIVISSIILVYIFY